MTHSRPTPTADHAILGHDESDRSRPTGSAGAVEDSQRSTPCHSGPPRDPAPKVKPLSGIELIGAVAIASGTLIALWFLLQRKAGEASAYLTREQLVAIEGAAVLLADDSVTIQKVAELAFTDAAAHFTCASDGKAASDLLRKEKFDVVIADVHMPAMNGYEVCEYAKKLRPQTPVLLLVGTFEAFNEDLYRECGAEEFLKKPFNSVNLMRTTSRLLLQRKGHRQHDGESR